MVVQYEPTGTASLRPNLAGTPDRATTRLFNAGLLIQDAAYSAHPYLAANVPELNTDTWRVFPDGTMETTYRLKPDLTWHDGHALTADDFAFAWNVFAGPDSAFSALVPFPQIAEVLAPDELTVLIRWRGAYPDAGAVYDTQFIPLPRHLLEATFQGATAEARDINPYWSTDFVGAGPYRLERWEPGSFIQGVAFDQHVLGRPKIDRVKVQFLPDENAVLAAFLAGQVHVTAAPTLRQEHGKVLMRDWNGTVVLIPIQPQFFFIQMRPELVRPRALGDVRVRKALAYAIDKPSLDETFFDGSGAVTYSMIAPRAVPFYPDIDRAITKYPYDPPRSEQLMTEAGLAKGTDGMYLERDGQPFVLDAWTNTGPEFQRSLAAFADGWQRVGIASQQSFLSAPQLRDNELRAKLPMHFTSAAVANESFAAGFASSLSPSAANRWRGGNRIGYSNPEYDRFVSAYNNTLNRTERNQQIVQLERIVSEELPIIMLWHNFQVVVYAASVSGPDTRSARDLVVWNIHEWEMR